VKWIVVNNVEMVCQISERTIDWMKIVMEKDPALYQEAKLELSVEPWEVRSGPHFNGVPCIIVACAPKDKRTAPPTDMIVIHQIQLSVLDLGLGTFFTGSVNTAAQRYPLLIQLRESQ
jgi:hypothetical protein